MQTRAGLPAAHCLELNERQFRPQPPVQEFLHHLMESRLVSAAEFGAFLTERPSRSLNRQWISRRSQRLGVRHQDSDA